MKAVLTAAIIVTLLPDSGLTRHVEGVGIVTILVFISIAARDRIGASQPSGKIDVGASLRAKWPVPMIGCVTTLGAYARIFAQALCLHRRC